MSDENVFGALGDLFREADDEFEDPRAPSGGAGSMTSVRTRLMSATPCVAVVTRMVLFFPAQALSLPPTKRGDSRLCGLMNQYVFFL